MLVSSEKCTGCFACMNICPNRCISAIMDEEGFLHPVIERKQCIGCKKCEEVCPMMNEPLGFDIRIPTVYAAWSKDEAILEKSSSGGIFGVFAKYIIENNGVVFGAAYAEDLEVVHIGVETLQELNKLHGSKYVQSFIGLTYQEAKEVLDQGRYVLFSGTPCQIAGLYHFLLKDYDKLFTCDIVCHGVPAPGVYRKYIEYVQEREGKALIKLEMRSKRKGWIPISSPILYFIDGSEIILDNALKDPYMNGFLSDIYLRKPCYSCKYAKTERESDITLGDFWGIGNETVFNHKTEQGISLVLTNSDKGETLFGNCKDDMFFEVRTLAEAKKGNLMLASYQRSDSYRKQFFIDYQRRSFKELIPIYLKRRASLVHSIKKTVVKVIGHNNVKRIKRMIIKNEKY